VSVDRVTGVLDGQHDRRDARRIDPRFRNAVDFAGSSTSRSDPAMTMIGDSESLRRMRRLPRRAAVGHEAPSARKNAQAPRHRSQPATHCVAIPRTHCLRFASDSAKRRRSRTARSEESIPLRAQVVWQVRMLDIEAAIEMDERAITALRLRDDLPAFAEELLDPDFDLRQKIEDLFDRLVGDDRAEAGATFKWSRENGSVILPIIAAPGRYPRNAAVSASVRFDPTNPQKRAGPHPPEIDRPLRRSNPGVAGTYGASSRSPAYLNRPQKFPYYSVQY
jgi:Family of unknown function (DUF6519)